MQSSWFKITSYSVFIFLGLTQFAIADQSPNQIYPGNPEFSKLSPEVARDKMFANAPKRNVKQTNLSSRDNSNDRPYSHYHMHPVVTENFKTKYWTHEEVNQGDRFSGFRKGETAIVEGKGISFGGIFWPLEIMTANDQHGKQVFYNKIDINAMEHVSGHLFPLQVGNDLQFKFTRLHERRMGRKHTFTQENGIMEYKVTDRYTGFPSAHNPVPGNIYTIIVYEQTNLHPHQYMTDIYEYSEQLGWYVGDKYFTTKNKLIATYQLYQWH